MFINKEIMNTEIQPTDKSSRLFGCGGVHPRRGSGENESTRVPRHRPHLSRVCEYAAAVGLGQGRDICREAMALRGARGRRGKWARDGRTLSSLGVHGRDGAGEPRASDLGGVRLRVGDAHLPQ